MKVYIRIFYAEQNIINDLRENVVKTYNLKMVFSARSVLYFFTFLAMNSSYFKR